MGKLTTGALRAVLVVVLAGTVFVQALMVWALATDPEDGSLPLTPLRLITILGMVSVQVVLVCVWRLVTMVRRGTVFSDAAFRYVDVVIGAIVAAALVWFAVTILDAPGQRADPGVTVIMGGVGVAILGVALLVLVLRMILAQTIAVDIDVMLARRKMSVGELADRVGITPANLAVLKNGRAKAVRFATLAALCEVLKCQPGDLLRWEAEDAAGR
jgi:DNA-binding Xre family transcriptional regulator